MSDAADRVKAALSDRYTILRELGAGGMATVYLAEDIKHHRKVAIKVLRPELAAAVGSERFLREIGIAANLIHPHILPLHDSGEADGILYYVMPYVEGETLRDRLNRETQLPLGDALQIAREVADALGAAHKQGVIHRDIKPENILFAEGHAVLADFGIARAVTEAGGDQLTETGMSLGTPTYMSPEQASGQHDIDGRSDVYSLGCVLYEMLAGEPPFTGPTAIAITARKLSESMPSLGVVRDTIPEQVEQALRTALARVPADRFLTAHQFAEELTLSERQAHASLRGAEKAPRRTIARAAAVVLAVALVAGGFGVWSRFSGPRTVPGEIPTLAVLPFANLGSPEDDYFAAGMTEEITSRLAEISGLLVISRQSAMQYHGSQKTLRQIGEELGVAYVLEGTIRTDRRPDGSGQVRVTPQLISVSDDAHLWTNRYTVTLAPGEIFAVQEQLAEQVAHALDVTLLEPERRRLAAKPTDNLEAYDYYLRGNDYATRGSDEDDSRIALEMYQKAVALDPDFALAYAKLSRTHSRMWWYFWDRTEARLATAKNAVDKALALDPDLPEAHAALGYYHYWGFLDYERALAAFAVAQEGLPNDSDVFLGIAFIRRRQGRMEESLASLHRAADLEPRSAVIAAQLATTYGLSRNAAQAERYFDRAISLRPDWADPYVWKVWWVYLRSEGNTEPARAVLERARDVVAGHEVTDPLWVLLYVLDGDYQAALHRLTSLSAVALDHQFEYLLTAQLYAEIYGLLGEQELARTYYDSARTVLEGLVRDTPEDARYHSALGIAHAGLGRTEDALREGELAVRLLPVSKEAWVGVRRVEDLAHIYTMVGRYDQAVDRLEYLLSIPSEVTVQMLAIDTKWDPLREHPGFQRLVENVGRE